MTLSTQYISGYPRPCSGPVQAHGKMWLYEIHGQGSPSDNDDTARAYSFTGPATPGDMPGAWTFRSSSPIVGDGYFKGNSNHISGATYVDPTTGKCWATNCTHHDANGDNGGDPRNPYGTSPGDSTGVNDVFHGVIHIYNFDPANPSAGWVEKSPQIHEHNITFESPFDYIAECRVHTVSCPGNTFSAGDVLTYRTTPSLVSVTQPAICYKVSGDTVLFFVTDNTTTEYGGSVPDALSNDGVTYIDITYLTASRHYMMLDIPSNNFSVSDKVRILSIDGVDPANPIGTLMEYSYNYYGGWNVVEEVFASRYVSLFPNNKQLNRNSLNRNPVDSNSGSAEYGNSNGTVARYSDTGPGLYFVNQYFGPALINDCSGPSPHVYSSGQLGNLGFNYFCKVVPRPNGDLVAVFMGEGGLTFATSHGSWADSTIIGTNDPNGVPLFGIIDVYPDSLGGVYVLTGTGTPASISSQIANFFCIRINPDNTFSKTTLPISAYIQDDPTNLSEGDFPLGGDPCVGGYLAPIQCSAIGNLLVAEGKVFITVRWADKSPYLFIETEGDNAWTATPENVPAYYGSTSIMSTYLYSPITVQYINDPANVAAGKNGIYIVFQNYVSTGEAYSYPAYLYAIRTGTNTYTTSSIFTDTNSSVFAQTRNIQIFMAWDLVTNQPMFMPFPSSSVTINYTFEYVSDTPPPSLSCSCNNPPEGNVDIFYTHTFTATDGTPPYTWSLGSGSLLPLGLVLDPTTGTISGTPLQVGSFSFVIEVTDSLGLTATANCTGSEGPDSGVGITVNLGCLICESVTPPVAFKKNKK